MPYCDDKSVYKPCHAKDIPQVFTIEEGFCNHREDNLHCKHWWNNGEPAMQPCCACGFNGGVDE